MKKTWLTGITMASVAISAGVAYAGVNAMHHASAESAPATAAQDAVDLSITRTYQIGVAGLVTLTTDGTTLTVDSANPGTGWTLVGTTVTGTHAEVQFTDGQQVVTLIADATAGDITVSVTNVAAGTDPTATTADMPVTVVTDDEQDDDDSSVPSPSPVTIAPPSSHTVSSGSDDDEEEHDGEHEDEGDDD